MLTRKAMLFSERRSIGPEVLSKALDRLEDESNVDVLSQLVRQCGLLKALPEARQVHSHIVRAGLFDGDAFLPNKVVQMYGRCGDLQEAWRAFNSIKRKNDHSYSIMIAAYAQNGCLGAAKELFHSMPRPGVVVWNSIITGNLQSGDGHGALHCFWQMASEGCHSSPYSFLAVLDACARIEALEQGKKIHELIISQGLEADSRIGSALVSLYRKCGRLEQAREVFDQIPEPDVSLCTQMVVAYAKNGELQEARNLFDRITEKDSVSWTCIITAYAQRRQWNEARKLFNEMPDRDLIAWNSMIAVYTQNGQCRSALELFLLMDLDGIQINSVTLLSVLDACISLGAKPQALRIHESITGTGLDICLPVANALTNMYGKFGELEKAKAVFHSMPQRDIISWTGMISSCSENGHLEEAKAVLDRMPEVHSMAWTTMLVAYAQNGYLKEARSFYDKMQQPEVVGWTALITAYAQNGCGKQALSLLKAGDLEGLQTDLVSFVGILDACACCGALREGKLVHAETIQRGLHHDVTVGTALVNMYGKCGQVGLARMVFEEMPYRNAVTWNSLLTAYAQNGHSRDTLELFPLMNLEGFTPTEVTFIAIFSACAQAGLLENGRKQFLSMRQDYQVSPCLEVYVCMVDLLGRVGSLEAAEEVSQLMPFEGHGTAWTALLGCCKLHGDRERGARAAERALKLEPGTSAPYALLSEACVAADSPKDGSQLG